MSETAKSPQSRRYPPVGRCIYCMQSGEGIKLGEEHIFPLSLGGSLILPKASCSKCETIINREVEGICTGEMLGLVRKIFKMPSRNKQSHPCLYPLKIKVHGETKTIDVPIEDYPSVPVLFPKVGFPGILRTFKLSNQFRESVVVPVLPNVPDNEQRLARIRNKYGEKLEISVEAKTQVGPFTRMIAKIAHSYAVAEFGLSGFQPFLPDVILGKSEFVAHFVGGIDMPPTVPYPESRYGTHHISCAVADMTLKREGGEIVGGTTFLLALVRLFKDLGTPTYLVAIGIPSDETRRHLELFNLPITPLGPYRIPSSP